MAGGLRHLHSFIGRTQGSFLTNRPPRLDIINGSTITTPQLSCFFSVTLGMYASCDLFSTLDFHLALTPTTSHMHLCGGGVLWHLTSSGAPKPLSGGSAVRVHTGHIHDSSFCSSLGTTSNQYSCRGSYGKFWELNGSSHQYQSLQPTFVMGLKRVSQWIIGRQPLPVELHDSICQSKIV